MIWLGLSTKKTLGLGKDNAVAYLVQVWKLSQHVDKNIWWFHVTNKH